MDSSEEHNKLKILQSIQKNKSLIEEKKYYEFAQKIKLLSHRKMQTKKLKQAEIYLQKGIQELYKIQQSDQQIGLQLVQQLLQIYFANQQMITEQSIAMLLKSTSVRNLSQKYAAILFNLLKKIMKSIKYKELTKTVVDFYTSKANYIKVQSIVCSLEREVILNFLNTWCEDQEVKKQEIPAIWSRMALMRGIAKGLNEAKQLYSHKFQEYEQNPYFKFTIFLIKVAEIKSKQAYLLLQQSYSSFLASDNTFKMMTQAYGKLFLNIERKEKGLQKMFQTFIQ